MKIRSLAMFAISGAFFASCAFIAPAMADEGFDEIGNQTAQQLLAENSNGNGNSNSTDGTTTPGASSSSSSSSSDDGSSPDMATGDDDY